jgi:hypothetical protein
MGLGWRFLCDYACHTPVDLMASVQYGPVRVCSEYSAARTGYQPDNLAVPVGDGYRAGVSLPEVVTNQRDGRRCVVQLIIAVYFFSQDMFINHGLLSSGWIYGMILFTFVLAEEVIGKYIPDFLMRLGDTFLYLIHTLMNNGIGSALPALALRMDMSDFYFHCCIRFAGLSIMAVYRASIHAES